jgi:carboxymethylenebutenolidase
MGETNIAAVWDEHMRCEFVTKNVDDTMATMIEGAHVNHVPVLTGGVGWAEIRDFYSRFFIPRMPPDTETVPISRTVGECQVVEELIFKFTHTVRMDWMLPGIEPTGKRVEVPLVAIVGFHNGKVSHEHIYWDQASVLVQLGLINPEKLPVAGIESAEKVRDPSRAARVLHDSEFLP